MKLTLKDKAFLERLRPLFEEKDLRVELKADLGLKRLVLRQNYGDRIESRFGMSAGRRNCPTPGSARRAAGASLRENTKPSFPVIYQFTQTEL